MLKYSYEVYVSYIPNEDKTVVWRDTYIAGELFSSEIVGWYCGEPDPAATEHYSNGTDSLRAIYAD